MNDISSYEIDRDVELTPDLTINIIAKTKIKKNLI